MGLIKFKILFLLLFASSVVAIVDSEAEKLAEREFLDAKGVDAVEVDKMIDSYSNLDYQTIYSYIRSIYKKVSDDDAKAISNSLVAYGKQYDLDPKLAAALMARESSFNKEAVSVTGARGLGQIKDFNYDHLNIEDPHDINQNVSGTINYLKMLIQKWKGNDEDVSMGLASYFRGYTNVKNDQKKTGSLNDKTQGYVDDILDYYDRLKAIRERLDSDKAAP